MPDTFLYDAFLSYRNCEPDRGFAWDLLARLESAGLKLAIDRRDFNPAAAFLEEMERCIRESRFTLAVISPRYLESGNTWEEAVLCKVLDMSERRRRLIPLILEPVERPLWLYDIVGVDFSAPQALVDPHARLLAALGVSQRVQAADAGAGPESRCADAATHALAKALEESYRREEELLSAGADATAVRQEILELRRQLREGGRLQAGDFLADGRFRLIERLGRGGFATVWKAFDRRQRGLAAIKVLHGQLAEDRSRRERFFRGARKMEELHHPGIVRVTEKHLQDGGYHFYVMEYLAGGDLRQAVLGKRLAPAALLPLLQEVAAALSFAHENGVIHRDVKPANILLDAEGHPKLTDFDLVRAEDTTGGTLDGGMLGTFLYSAPETMSAPQDVTQAADVYSLAMTVVFCLYGADLPLEVLQNAGAFLRELPCPSGLQEVLRKAIALRPEGRFTSVAELSRALAGCVTSPPLPASAKKDTGRQALRRPAVQGLVMGFGGTGAQILTCLKEQMVLEHGRLPDSVRFLLFDTIANREPGASLGPDREYCFLSDHEPDLAEHVFELLPPEASTESLSCLADWLHAPWLRLHLPLPAIRIVDGTGQQRQLGRFAMFQNAERILQETNQGIRRLQASSERGPINVWIIGSAAGGTGAGCFVDAAFLARRAADNVPVAITGVVVLPEVYADMGISQGRAYSLFRELDRFQEQGFRASDRFVDGKVISSRVRYDSLRRITSEVGGPLFDNLFYVGERCATQPERASSFTGVASSVHPFLNNGAPSLLEKLANNSAAAATFGAARLSIPAEIYADVFAWEEVERYLERAVPRREREQGLDLEYGSAEDRRSEGEEKVRSLLPLFSVFLDMPPWQEGRLLAWGPRSIVKEWCGFGGPAVAGLPLTPSELQVAQLTYINPYISWTEDDPDRVPDVQRNLQTFRENKSAKGPKEGQVQSRDRFADELEWITQRYCSHQGGERSFESGRRLVIEKLSSVLRSRVDELVIHEVQQNPRLSPAAEAPDSGTVMTRLFQSFRELLADGGALQRIEATISRLIQKAQWEAEARQAEAVRAVRDLREFAPSWLGSSVDEPQRASRDASAEYIAAYQTLRLLLDMQKLVREVKERFAEWTAQMKRMFDGLVLAGAYSGLAETRTQLLLLGDRLRRLAENPRVLIGCVDSNPADPTMQGFREILKQDCVCGDGGISLADSALSGSAWQAMLDVADRPQIHLIVRSEEGEQRYGTDTVTILHREFHDRFRPQIDVRMDEHDIFDYLRHVQAPPYEVDADKIVQRLTAAAKVLIDAPEADLCALLYRDPRDPEKRRLSQAISLSIRGSGSGVLVDSYHSDRFSLTLLKILKLSSPDGIQSIRECRKDYLAWQQASLNGRPDHDEELYRAQVYHPFRPELEAWYIERRHSLSSNRLLRPADHIPPRLVRLLEEPAMMQAFVHCVATGAIEKVDGNWIWHDTANSRDVILTERESEGEADLVRAAVVFVLQQREGGRRGLAPIRLKDAQQSVLDASQAQGCSRDDLIREFVTDRLDSYLDRHFPGNDEEETHQRERSSLRMLFQFYTHPETGTQLSERLAL